MRLTKLASSRKILPHGGEILSCFEMNLSQSHHKTYVQRQPHTHSNTYTQGQLEGQTLWLRIACSQLIPHRCVAKKGQNGRDPTRAGTNRCAVINFS